MKRKSFRIRNWLIELVLGDTLWWNNDWKPGHVFRLREDKFFSVSRIYSRTMKLYFYSLIIGKLKISFLNEEQT